MFVSPQKSTTVRTEHRAPTTLRLAVAALESVSPGLAASFAERLFTTPRRRAPRDWERSLLAGAEPFRVRAGGRELRGARAGEGPTVLLVHGWSGGGSQLAAFAPPLLAAGCSVAVFDGPAHGASGGRTTTMPDLADAAAAVARHVGARAAVAHSLGGAAVALALARGLALDAAVLVAPPRAAAPIFEAFCGALGLGETARERLRLRLERRVRARMADLDVAAVAATLRTPALVVHDGGDREVPFEDGAAVAAAWPGARLLATERLGHRRVLRDADVIEETRSFLLARLPRCGCGRLGAAVAHGAARCETCLLELHLAHREERQPGGAAA